MDTLTDKAGFQVTVESLIGGRKENQDNYGFAETSLGLLVVVCDGMGGGPAGKTASNIATAAIIDYVSEADGLRQKDTILAEAVISANRKVLEAVNNNPSLKGMGTTCVCVLITPRCAYIVHVGDSRFYQLRSNRAVFRTADHSYVGELVRHGTITEEEARTSMHSNVITRAIGGAVEVDPEIDVIEYKPGDRFALMSDGIWGTLPEMQLVKFLTKPETPAVLVPQICNNIDNLGKDNGGGHDNLTLAIIDIPTVKGNYLNNPDHSPIPAEEKQIKEHVKINDAKIENDELKEETLKNKKRIPILTLALGILVIACIIFIIFLLVRDNNTEEIMSEESVPKQVLTDTNLSNNNITVKNSGKEEIIDRETNDISKIEDKNVSQNNQQETLSNSNEDLVKALTLLDNLKNFEGSDMDFHRCKAARGKIIDEIISNLEKGAAASNVESWKIKVEDIAKDVKADKSKLIQIDKNEHRSTRESLETIALFYERISSLINNNK